MTSLHRRTAALLASVLLAVAAPASGEPITVAEFRWDFDAAFIPGTTCPDPLDLECVPSDPIAGSIFSLTGLWDYDAIAAPELNGSFTVSDGTTIDWLPTNASPFNFDQFPLFSAFDSASTTIFFTFLGETITLGATLAAPGFALLSFNYEPTPPTNPVPEPGSLALLGIGLVVAARSIARRQSSPRPVQR